MKRIYFILVPVLGMLVLCAMPLGAESRQPAVAGAFYPSDPAELSQEITKFLAQVPEQHIDGVPLALLVPHAGHIYSGQTAAYSYRLLDPNKIDTVFLIGNSHHFPLRKCAVYPDGTFKTPLGEVPIDHALTEKLVSLSPLMEMNKAPHMPEHSLEVQLPFLQRSLKNFSIVPVLMGDLTLEECQSVGNAIALTIVESKRGGRAIIIASSDMSHYASGTNATMTDTASLKKLEKFNPQELEKEIEGHMNSQIPNLVCVFCGKEALYTVMFAAKALGADSIKVLHYENSGDVTGDQQRVVGYGAAVFYHAKNKGAMRKSETIKERPMNDFSVSKENQQELLRIARNSVQEYLSSGKMPLQKSSDPQMGKPAAVFVTLTEHGDLRGCIGTTVPQEPLNSAVARMAIAAATEDTRFNSVKPEELKDIRFEISVLSPMERVKSADDIKQNIHGVLVRRGGRSGLFLPQVWEHFSTKEDFLSELCSQKAGLERSAWKDKDTELSIFTVFAFQEK